jgi:hypothetical protein
VNSSRRAVRLAARRLRLLTPGDVFLSAGVEASLRVAREALQESSSRDPVNARPATDGLTFGLLHRKGRRAWP